jgi:pyridoxamine 5'-phosphate oxidase
MHDDISLDPDPLIVFQSWYVQAVDSGAPFPEAMALATADRHGRPSVRVVLYKGLDAGRIAFFTNLESRKSRELTVNPRAAVVFHWPALGRQVRIEGDVEKLPEIDDDAYFQSRPRSSQLGAWASPQSQTLPDRAALEARFAEAEQRFAGATVPRPPFWGGYRLLPSRFEFWINRDHRLHDRFAYERSGAGWRMARLAP